MKVKANVAEKLYSHQQQFVVSTNKFTALIAGYGAGKSDAVVYRALNLAQRRKRDGQKAVIAVIAPTYRILEDSNIIDFENILTNLKVKSKSEKKDKKIILPYFNSEIWFRSADRPENLVAFDATDAILDEFDIPSPEYQRKTWQKINARLRGCQNTTLAISTTPEGFKETYELFINKKMGRLITARSYHNRSLSKDYIWDNIFRIYGVNVPEIMPEGMTFDQAYEIYKSPLLQQYCGGEFVNVNGLAAYWAFKRENNCVMPNSDIVFEAMSKSDYIIGMDFNVNPMSAVVSAWSKKGLVVFDEISLNNSNTDEMISVIKQRYPNKTITVCPDLTGGARKTASAGYTDINLLQKAGFKIVGAGANSFVRDSLNTVNLNLQNNNVYINYVCTKLVNDLEKVVTDERGEIVKKDGKLTHISDAFRYLVERIIPIVKPGKWS